MDKLLVSGDNNSDYDEGAMMAMPSERGVAPGTSSPTTAAGTYDSCYRAKAIFQVDEAIVDAGVPSAAALFLYENQGCASAASAPTSAPTRARLPGRECASARPRRRPLRRHPPGAAARARRPDPTQ